MPQAPKLPARLLTISLLGASLTTLSLVLGYTVYKGKPREADLPVDINVGQYAVLAPGSTGQVLKEAVSVTNTTDAELTHVSLSVNGFYHLYYDQPLKPNDAVAFPLDAFMNKANKPYVPSEMSVKKVTAYGQLPSGARGVRERILRE